MIKDGDKIGRVCPVVRQQCRLRAGCPTFEDPRAKSLGAIEKVRAWLCRCRGVALYADEVDDRKFHATLHSMDARHNAAIAGRRRQLTQLRRMAELPMFPEEASEARRGT